MDCRYESLVKLQRLPVWACLQTRLRSSHCGRDLPLCWNTKRRMRAASGAGRSISYAPRAEEASSPAVPRGGWGRAIAAVSPHG